MIEIKNLTKRFKNHVVLNNLNLKIEDNSTFGLVGINGSGKSTLLRLIAGVYKPDEGEILIDGENILVNEKKKKQVFFLPDDLFYTPQMNAENMADLYRSFYDFNEAVFAHYLGAFRLDTDISLRSYSKGMKRQLFVCIAFAASPKYLLLDEAFDGLDPSARMIFRHGLTALTKAVNGTALISSHSLKELGDICNSYGAIDRGMIHSYQNLGEVNKSVFKFQLAFAEIPSRENFDFEILSFEGSGKIVTIVARGDKQDILAKIDTLNPLIIEEKMLDFEQFFISGMNGRMGL